MADQLNDATRRCYFLAHLKLDDCDWFSLHLSNEDAERQLRTVAEEWDVWFTPDDEPTGVLHYGVIDQVPLLGPKESGRILGDSNDSPLTDEDYRAPESLSDNDFGMRESLTDEEFQTWQWLVIYRDVPGGLSADDLANDFEIAIDVAVLRLIGLTARGLAHEVSPERYRVGEKVD